MSMKSVFLTTILVLVYSTAHCESSLDYLRSTGKIYAVVTGVILIFLMIVLYLVRLDRKISKLESEINNE